MAAKKQVTRKPVRKARWVVVTTEKRGVFFGLTTAKMGAEPLILDTPRMCVYWDQATKGVLGLAATGPTSGCRVTAAPQRIELRGVTSIMDCTPEAVAAWQAAPWA